MAIGAPIEVLGSEARRAQLLVLGDRGLGGLAGLLLGSVAVGLAAHGACPVVIVRGNAGARATTESPVVVGIDGFVDQRGGAGIRVRRGRGPRCRAGRRARVVADGDRRCVGPVMDWDAATAEEDAVLAERLAGWEQKHPEVAVRRTVVRDGAVRALVAASREAQLVVVGSAGAATRRDCCWGRSATVSCTLRTAPSPSCDRGPTPEREAKAAAGGVQRTWEHGSCAAVAGRREQAALS